MTVHDTLSHDPGISEVFADMCCLDDTDFEAKYYTTGIAAPRYPMPALADTNAVMALGYLSHAARMRLAWDGIWRNDLFDTPICY